MTSRTHSLWIVICWQLQQPPKLDINVTRRSLPFLNLLESFLLHSYDWRYTKEPLISCVQSQAHFSGKGYIIMMNDVFCHHQALYFHQPPLLLYLYGSILQTQYLDINPHLSSSGMIWSFPIFLFSCPHCRIKEYPYYELIPSELLGYYVDDITNIFYMFLEN